MIHRSHAFTLLELLLVVFLLAALAASAVTLTDEVDVQARQELTAGRRELVRTAILGDPSRTVNGRPLQTGFVVDMGRLPVDLDELLRAPAGVTWRQLDTWEGVDFPPGAPGFSGGWRGPYVQATAYEERLELSTGAAVYLPVFRDGWGGRESDAALDTRYFGWRFSDLNGQIDLGSFGRDGVPNDPALDPLLPDADYPRQPTDPSGPWLVRDAEWRLSLDVGPWSVEVASGPTPDPATDELGLVLLVPDSDPADSDGWLNAASLRSTRVPASGFAYPETFSFPGGGDTALQEVPAGPRGLALVEFDTTDAPVRVAAVWLIDIVAGSSVPHLQGATALEGGP